VAHFGTPRVHICHAAKLGHKPTGYEPLQICAPDVQLRTIIDVAEGLHCGIAGPTESVPSMQ